MYLIPGEGMAGVAPSDKCGHVFAVWLQVACSSICRYLTRLSCVCMQAIAPKQTKKFHVHHLGA